MNKTQHGGDSPSLIHHFETFELPQKLNDALKAMEFEIPTPIQAQAIPIALKGRDLIGCAQTGTGKTAAFCIPTLVHLLADRNKTALILAPTRELAMQIEGVWKDLTRFSPEIRSAILVGGNSMQPQMQALKRNPRLLIATPGRLIDHLQRGSLNLSRVGILILDEADRMLDMGFAPQLSQIMRFVPQSRQTLLFSATWSPVVDDLAKKYLKTPARVSVEKASRAAQTVHQSMIATTMKEKNEALLDELNEREGSVLVFVRTKSRTDRVAKYLSSYGLDVNRIHGGRTQGQRNAALSAFRVGKVRILVATDIAARGIDVVNIQHVINYDLPQVAEDYIHRIGRTGRAGSEGCAVSFVTPEDRSQWRDITHLLKKGGTIVSTHQARTRAAC